MYTPNYYAWFCRFPRFSRPPSAGDIAVAFSSLKALKSLMYVSSILLCGENFVDQVENVHFSQYSYSLLLELLL